MGGTVKINHARHNEAQLGYAPSGSLISSEPTIIFDGKTLTGDPDGIWSEGGTTNQNLRATIGWREYG